MAKTIEFQGLKFRTSFGFTSGKQRNKFFDKVLIESIYKYQETQKDYFAEKLHVVFRYFLVAKVAAFVILGFACISSNIQN